MSDDRDTEALRARYRELVDHELPAAAAARGWSLRHDHCFGRILLDDAVGGCWYDVLDRRGGTAYRQLDDERLAHAVGQGEQLLVEGEPLLRHLDARSLAWRGKRGPRRGRTRTAPTAETGQTARTAPVDPEVTNRA